MTLKDFYQQLAIPDSCYLDRRIYKKQFYDNAQLSKTDQQHFSNRIDTIEWRYTLKPATINIPKYVDDQREYLEIALLQVTLKGEAPTASQRTRLAEIIQRAIPYPLMLVFVQGNHTLALQLAYKRINQADPGKMTIEESFDSGWIDLHQLSDHQQSFLDDFIVTHCRFTDLYQFYQDLVSRIIALNCDRLSGYYSLTGETAPQRQEQLEEINSLQQQIMRLRTALKKETQFNRKVELNIQIKQLDQKIQSLQSQL